MAAFFYFNALFSLLLNFMESGDIIFRSNRKLWKA